jgi:hypothetical protein
MIEVSDIDRLMNAIEECVTVRKLWRCNAGWGLMIIRDHEVEPEPPFPNHSEDQETRERKSAELRAWRIRRQATEIEHSYIDRYYASIEECVRSEHERIVIGGER